MTYDLMPKSIWRVPMISIPSMLEDMGDALQSPHLLNGLSVSEDDTNVYVEAAMPGLNQKEISVTFSKGMLTIKGEKKEEEKKKTYHRKATSSFLYRLTPGDVDLAKEPQATYKNGMMTVTFSKMPESKPKKIAVKTE